LIPKVEMVLSWVTQAPLPGGGFVIEVAVLNFDIKKMVGMVLSRVTDYATSFL
jgi:hypothetical protein